MKRKRIFPDAVADIRNSTEHPNLQGQVRFYQRKNCVLMEANVWGLPATETGFFGFHIHEGGNCTGENFADSLPLSFSKCKSTCHSRCFFAHV